MGEKDIMHHKSLYIFLPIINRHDIKGRLRKCATKQQRMPYDKNILLQIGSKRYLSYRMHKAKCATKGRLRKCATKQQPYLKRSRYIKTHSCIKILCRILIL